MMLPIMSFDMDIANFITSRRTCVEWSIGLYLVQRVKALQRIQQEGEALDSFGGGEAGFGEGVGGEELEGFVELL